MAIRGGRGVNLTAWNESRNKAESVTRMESGFVHGLYMGKGADRNQLC